MKKSFHMMIFRVHQAYKNRIRPMMQEIGISSGQPKILLYVRDHENCRLKDVAAYCDIKPATTSRIIEKLLEEGYLTKTSPKEDRRAICLKITKAGMQSLQEWIQCCQKVEEEMLKGFDEKERKQFFDYLIRAYENTNDEKGGEDDA
ncbi:MarR family winged helix-turn-helix transcriptional regulator [Merdibacter massiliensis]|uniref:MarR family winged helix-turn-helix transcriptional regulator n=1 Tax=Merdibacter massiliensis TaxID=1871030 RepID=UPI00096A5D5E|nr:MarR family transcriptional regulator [Merdibacter massiliensis]